VSSEPAIELIAGETFYSVIVPLNDSLRSDRLQSSGIPSFLGMGEVDPDVWHPKYRSTEAAM
jgi:hypothetical protein